MFVPSEVYRVVNLELDSELDMSISEEPGNPLTSEGGLVRTVRSRNRKLLRSADAKEDLEGVARESAVLEPGDAFSCWPVKGSSVIWMSQKTLRRARDSMVAALGMA